MKLEDDITKGDVIVAEGRTNFMAALDEYAQGSLKTRHLELLCCEGCIMGPGMSEEGKKFMRRSCISSYVAHKLHNFNYEQWETDMKEWADIDLSTSFTKMDRRTPRPDNENILNVLHSMGKHNEQDHLDCGACGYDTCMEHAIAVVQGLAENEMCLPYTIEQLHNPLRTLIYPILSWLRHVKRLSSRKNWPYGSALGRHCTRNQQPLGVITMYSNLLLDEIQDETTRNDLQLIVEQADRCRKIVGGLLNFARKNQVRLKKPTSSNL
jgi:hypothetical protein